MPLAVSGGIVISWQTVNEDCDVHMLICWGVDVNLDAVYTSFQSQKCGEDAAQYRRAAQDKGAHRTACSSACIDRSAPVLRASREALAPMLARNWLRA